MFLIYTAGLDFMEVSVEVLFEQPGEMCINVSALEDIFLEDPECMTIILETADGNVMLNTSSATVVIEDRVRRCISYAYNGDWLQIDHLLYSRTLHDSLSFCRPCVCACM